MPDALMPELWRKSQAQALDELPLFSHDPQWLQEPATPIEKRFAIFHSYNPAVYRRLEMLALNALKRGERRIGIAALIEYLRKDQETSVKPYRIDNSFRSLYARLLVHNNRELEQLIELRHRRERAS